MRNRTKKKHTFFKLPSTNIIFRYFVIAFLTISLTAIVLPIILNYPPNSLNNDFDIQMSGIPFIAQIAIIFAISYSGIAILTKKAFKPIDKWYLDTRPSKYKDKKRIHQIRKKCFSLPYVIFFGETLIPIVGVIVVLALTGSHPVIMISKILLLVVSLFLLFAVSSYIFSKSIYSTVLRDTYTENSEMGLRVTLKQKILLQVLPISIMGILFTSLIAYNQVIKTEEDSLYSFYKNSLSDTFDTKMTYNSSDVIKDFSNFDLLNYRHSQFIIYPDGTYLTLSGFDPSNFVIEYTNQMVGGDIGRTYDGYGVDTQGTFIRLNTEKGTYTLCVLYSINSSETLWFLLIDFLFIILITFIALNLFATSIQEDISTVADSLSSIAVESPDAISKLPVLANDEIGDLCIAYNQVQELNAKHIDKIKNSQNLLIEKERLASLGQMVGGIAHNLKTPIMSIAGADEALTQLINELHASIGNSSVTNEDFHDIANDMQSWIDKIKTHTSYMSDVITAVKGQTVTLSDSQVYYFSTSDVFKQVDILMKHELKSSLVTLKIKNNVPDYKKIKGNINSLVQILNNMISNSIQAYDGKADETIDLIANVRDNNLELIVRDYGPGLPDIVKDKLFKQMITTKGKSGTGLGLFMSYSNIKAHFHGDLNFKTSSKGTSFIITIPFDENN